MRDFIFQCVGCGRRYMPGEIEYTCPECGPVRGTLDVVYQRPATLIDPYAPGLFRYRNLPFQAKDAGLHVPVGWTPLIDAPRLASRLGVRRLFLKDETRNPSGSMKDRATVLALARARAMDAPVIAAASTGNAASSLSVLAAAAGMQAVIFCPRSVPRAKLAQMLLFGARVVRVAGNYDQAFDLCAAAVERFGWYSRNTATNPFLAEGKKTAALEIAEQLGFGDIAGVAVGVGDGCVFGAQYKGFAELYEWGFIRRMPRLFGVQARGAAPLVQAFEAGADLVTPMVPDTFADSISVGVPRDQVKALRAARRSDGAFVAVSDDEIRAAMGLLAREGGVFAEPAGAAGFAGLVRLADQGRLQADGTYVAIVTGNGLKDIEGVMSAVGQAPVDVQPDVDMDSLAGVLKDLVSQV